MCMACKERSTAVYLQLGAFVLPYLQMHKSLGRDLYHEVVFNPGPQRYSPQLKSSPQHCATEKLLVRRHRAPIPMAWRMKATISAANSAASCASC